MNSLLMFRAFSLPYSEQKLTGYPSTPVLRVYHRSVGAHHLDVIVCTSMTAARGSGSPQLKERRKQHFRGSEQKSVTGD